MSTVITLVMAGGQGTRFWPESTSKKPKQYLSLVGEQSLLKQTLDRFDGLVAKEHRYVVTVNEQEKLALEASGESLANDALIFEPSGRNTAPCILLSLAHLLNNGYSEDDIVAIVPSDHVILNEQGFRDTIKLASVAAAKDDAIVTIGITPNFPHTGFGYLHKGSEASSGIFHVAEFKEKPNQETAKEYVASGEYLWNAGMFVAQIGTLLREFKECSPETFSFFGKLKETSGKEQAQVYQEMPANSIDYAVMEKSKRVQVVPAMFDWNDLGSWDALESVIKPKEGNTLASCRAQYIDNSKGNIVYAPGKHVSLIDVEDLIIVSNEQTLLVMPKSKSQDVKLIVNSIKENKDLSDLL
jgi:mannose-1-phosphate guanylyltransferase